MHNTCERAFALKPPDLRLKPPCTTRCQYYGPIYVFGRELVSNGLSRLQPAVLAPSTENAGAEGEEKMDE